MASLDFDIEEEYKNVIRKVKRLSNGPVVESMQKAGLNYAFNRGVSLLHLKEMAREYPKHHGFAQKLWNTLDFRELRILATLIDNPLEVTSDQMDAWISDCHNGEMVEQVCNNLFVYVSDAFDKAVEWCSSKQPFIKMASFTLLSLILRNIRLKKEETDLQDADLDFFVQEIVKSANTKNVYIKKSAARALKQIGGFSLTLNHKVLEVVNAFRQSDEEAAQWIAEDSYDELIIYREQF